MRLTVNQLVRLPSARTAGVAFAQRALCVLTLPRQVASLADAESALAARGGEPSASGAAGEGAAAAAQLTADAAGASGGAAAAAAAASGSADAGAGAAGRGDADASEWSEPEALRYCELYAALCTVQPELLPGLADALPRASAEGARAALTASACTLARALGPASPHLCSLVRQHPDGSEPLVHAMLEAVVDGALPSQELVEV